MSSEDLAWWLGGNWVDRRQRRQIDDLEASVSVASHQTSRLRSQLARVEGGLQSKVDALARAFDAFVELSDIRNDMAVYTDAAIVRHQVRLILAAVTARRPVTPPELPNVPGYWLVPAARALYAHLDGKPGAVARHTEAATELDAERTRYFLAATRRLAGPVDLSVVQLAALLPADADAPVSRATRAFWLATADGAFGDAGRALLSSVLSGAVGRPDVPEADGDDTRLDAWAARIGGRSGGPDDATQALIGLREHYTTGVRLPTRDGADDEPGPQDGPLVSVIRSLIDEGHEPERDLLRRAEQLRSTVQSGSATDGYRPWDEPVGRTAELVGSDAFDDDTSPAARAVALRVAAPWLIAAAEQIADRGVAEPVQPHRVRLYGHDVTIDGNGIDQSQLATMRADIDRGYRPNHRRVWISLAVATAGLLVAVGGFATDSVALGILGIVVLLVAGGVAIAGWRSNAQRTASGRAERQALDRSVAREIESYRTKVARQAAQRDRLAAERAALSEAIGEPQRR